MSALAQYFKLTGKDVAGYDRMHSDLTTLMAESGMELNFEDKIEAIPSRFKVLKNIESCLVIYTPAIPENSIQLNFFRDKKFNCYKRSRILGKLSTYYKTIAIGGSHGKTTVSAMVTEILRKSGSTCSAFLGGISKPLGSNLLYMPESKWAVMEADEFDRSFLELLPQFLLVTSMDADHLDIYGDKDQLRESFGKFVGRLPVDGTAIIKEDIGDIVPVEKKINVKYYGLDKGRDYFAENISQEGLCYKFDLHTPVGPIRKIQTSVPGWINIENAVGAAAICIEAGMPEEAIREGIASFTGIRRRFDVKILSDKLVYIDDYAHHPSEIRTFIHSLRKLFPGKEITGVFQPHLYSRTRDFATEFARELSLLDDLIMLEIYPARERPIAGVSSQMILDRVSLKEKVLADRDELLNILDRKKREIIVTMGAGDIDRLVEPLKHHLTGDAS